MPSVTVPHPLKPHKRVMVELPYSSHCWTATDTKNAIEMALLAKYGHVAPVAPCVDLPLNQQLQHVNHDRDHTDIAQNEMITDWGVAKCEDNVEYLMDKGPSDDLRSTMPAHKWRRPLKGPRYCSIELE